jgi:hypothetical protein
MFTHPWKELQLTGSKMRALFEDDESGLRWVNASTANKSLASMGWLADFANVFYFGLLALSAVSLLYLERNLRGPLALPIVVIGVFTLGQLPFFGDPRFHFPMLPSFALLASVAVVGGMQGAHWRIQPTMWARKATGKGTEEQSGGQRSGS